MNHRIPPLMAAIVALTFPFASVTAAFGDEPQPRAVKSASAGEKSATVAKENEDDVVERHGQVIHFTGTQDTRNEEAEVEMKRWAKVKGVELDKLNDDEKLTFVAQMVKVDKSLSPNALRSLFNSAAVMKLFMTSPEVAKMNGLSKGEQKRRVDGATSILKAVATRLELPDAYWNFKVEEKDADKMLSVLGEAMGRALGEGVGNGLTDAFAKAVIGIFEPSKDSLISKIGEALVEAVRALVPVPQPNK